MHQPCRRPAAALVALSAMTLPLAQKPLQTKCTLPYFLQCAFRVYLNCAYLEYLVCGQMTSNDRAVGRLREERISATCYWWFRDILSGCEFSASSPYSYLFDLIMHLSCS